MIADRAAEQHPGGGRPPPSCQMEQQALRQQGIRGTCRRHRLAYRARAARKMGVAQGGSGSSDGGHVHRSSLELGPLSPLLLSQQSHAVVRSSGPSVVSSSARIPPTHVFTSYQTRLQHAPRACPASAASVPSISGCSKEVVQPPSRARLAALLKATPRPFT